MAYGLHTVKPGARSQQRKRRVGRGYGSGRAKTAGRGTKGQRSRAGGKRGLKRLGMRAILLQQPKVRGFKSPHPKPAHVNLEDLSGRFSVNDVVTPRALLQRGIIESSRHGVKVLGRGSLTHALTFRGVTASESARKKIIEAGGTIIDGASRRSSEQ